MATAILTNSKLLLDGYDLSGDLNSLALDYSAESLDATVFGDNTRRHRGGLTDVKLNAHGFVNLGTTQVDEILWNRVGNDTDLVVSVFPTGITQGSTTDKGFAFKALVATYNPGGTVGEMMAFDVTADSKGID